MKTSIAVIGLVAGILLAGCAHNSGSGGTLAQRIGPTVVDGVTYYPVKPDAVYENTPADYSINLPPGGAAASVTIISTNGIAIHLIDGTGQGSTKTLPR